jgi:copper homeostasis protein
MIRPRDGNFTYSDLEFAAMKASIAEMGTLADKLVFGVLDHESRVDVARCKDLVVAAGRTPCVFHRAVDQAPSLLGAIEAIADLGFDAVLTSGRRVTAVEGAAELSAAVQKFAGKIQIIIGGAVRASNIRALVADTNATWYHSSALTGDDGDVADGNEIVDMLKRIREEQ